MSGITSRINRLFSRRENLIVSAIDHVLEYGDQPGITTSRTAVQRCRGTDALLLSRRSLEDNADLFGGVDSPLPVVRINWSSAFYYPLEYRKGFTEIACSVEQAVRAGAEVVICSLFLENGDEQMEARNVALFAEVVRQKEALGIPLIGECYVVEHHDISDEQLHAKVKRVSRVMAELGADLIKCFYTGDRFREVVENTPVPVLTIGAEKLKTDLDVVRKAYNSVAHGARGIIFGRNIFMADDPPRLIKALDDVMNGGLSPEDALRKRGPA